MKIRFYFPLVILCFFGFNGIGQQIIDDNYRIYLLAGKPVNSELSIILEEESEQEEVLFVLDGKPAIKKVNYFKRTDPDIEFSFKELDKQFNNSHIKVDITQEGDKLILHLKEDLSEKFNAYNNGKNRRLVIEAPNGIKMSKISGMKGIMTIPMKIYLTGKKGSLENFSNNVATNINVAFTFGVSEQKYVFKREQAPKLINSISAFGFFGLNKLTLNKKNTNDIHDDDNMLGFSFGAGIQFGYGRVGASLLFGIDTPSSSYGKNWIFKNQPWIGIGLGCAIFK